MSSSFVLSTTERLNELIDELAGSSLEGARTVNDPINGTEVLKYDEDKSEVYWRLSQEYYKTMVCNVMPTYT